ncbi:MAG: hypothetical protein AAF682_10510 [Planctomycetota bacterium]
MRKLTHLAPCLLALPLGALYLQEEGDDPFGGGEQEDVKPATGTLARTFADERERLTEEIEGVWMVSSYEPAGRIIDQSNFQGFAMFQDGYLTLISQARSFGAELLGDGLSLFVQGGAYRYRVDDFLSLQTAAIMGFSNFANEDQMQFEEPGFPGEYRVEINESSTTLALIKQDSTVIRMVRLTQTEFPDQAAQYLDLTRGGLYGR